MLKQYLNNRDSGGTAIFWDVNWRGQEFASPAALLRWDPIVPHFLSGTVPGQRVLEGGCGLAPYLAVLEDAQRWTVGLDFAVDTLRRVRGWRPHTPLVGGDVASLPFSDASFDVYISQGVVEHFEAGPEAALSEAFRVLAPGGLLLISVPDFNLLRRLLMLGRRRRPGVGPGAGPWLRVDRHEITPPLEPSSFFQYLYTRREFTALLTRHRFGVEWDCGYSVLWGLKDIGAFRALFQFVQRWSGPLPKRGPKVSVAPPPAGIEGKVALSSRVRTLLLREQGFGLLTRGLVRGFTETCANMRLYAARKSREAA